MSTSCVRRQCFMAAVQATWRAQAARALVAALLLAGWVQLQMCYDSAHLQILFQGLPGLGHVLP